jgi:predicted signal transduction protein with EAL and GGDEF domain
VATAQDRMTAEELLRAADLAMYAAKADGKRRHRMYEPSMLAGAVERLELEADLKRALKRDELDVYYQPIVELGDRRRARGGGARALEPPAGRPRSRRTSSSAWPSAPA